MTKRRWILITLLILLLAGCYKLFYKKWDNKTVSKNADIIIAVDVKRITNTIIWQFITSPSQWSKVSVFSSSDEETVSWEDMISLPDYIFIFHSKSHPGNAFYTVVEINNKKAFEKGLKQYHFEKTTYGSYISKEVGIEILQSDNKLLLANAAVENKDYLQQAAQDLFYIKEYISEDILEKNVSAASHLSVQIIKNDFLTEGAIITGNFDKTKIEINTDLLPNAKYTFNESIFSYNDTSLLSFGLTQPSPQMYNLLSQESKTSLTRLLNFNIDSMLLPGNTSYQLNISDIQKKIDTAVSYTYDDNFNAIEKKVADTVMEPAYNFTIAGKDADKVYNFWNTTGKLEQTKEGKLFTPVPFVKSYCNFLPELVSVSPQHYISPQKNRTSEAIMFLNISISKIPTELMKYLPQAAQNAITKIESVNAAVQKNNAQLKVRCVVYKKKNDLSWFE